MSNCNLKSGDSLSDRTLTSAIPNNTTVNSKKYIAKSGKFNCIAEKSTSGTTTGYVQHKISNHIVAIRWNGFGYT